MKARIINSSIAKQKNSRLGRIIVLTGARQIGKTVISKKVFSDYIYLSIEDPIKRIAYTKLSAEQWELHYPKAILDEVQKEATLIESIKSVYDQFEEPRYALLGSSQFLLLNKVRESLAGRCVIMEMYPLTLPEITTENEDDIIPESFLIQFLKNKIGAKSLLPFFQMASNFEIKNKTYDYYLKFGGYPILTDELLTDEERNLWLENYIRTFLERDIRDLANFRDLEPFIKLQNYSANLTGTILNYSSISKEAGITVPTVKRYIQYMELSYQVITLQAWSNNSIKRLTKSPKIHFMDYGVLKSILQKDGEPTGNEFESIIVTEIYKQIKSYQLPVKMWHLRTQDGREVDLLLETESGFIAIEIKKNKHAKELDARHFNGLEEILTKPLLHSFVITNDNETKSFGENITAIHAAYFLT